MTLEEIKKEMHQNPYPPNQLFDLETIENLPNINKRMNTIAQIFPDLCISDKFDALLDVGCNKGLFSFSFRKAFEEIIGIDPLAKMIDIAQKIRTAYDWQHISFFNQTFESFKCDDKFDVVHFGQCAHYIFRDAARKNMHPLSFLEKAKHLTKKFILIDGAFDGDPSVEFDAKQDRWPKVVKEMATIEGYAKALRPQFKLIKYGWSGDGATRYLAVFEKLIL